MAKLTKGAIAKVLTSRLRLKNPEFQFEVGSLRVSANVVSESFRGKSDHKRQEMIWDALDAEFGPAGHRRFGLFLAFTPEEWHIGEDVNPAPKKAKKAG